MGWFTYLALFVLFCGILVREWRLVALVVVALTCICYPTGNKFIFYCLQIIMRLHLVTIEMLRGSDPIIDNRTVSTEEFVAEGLTINRAGLWTFIYSTTLNLVVQYDQGNTDSIHPQ